MNSKHKISHILSEISQRRLKGKFIANPEMKLYTTIKTGGRVTGIYIPKDISDLKEFVLLCREKRISLLPLGNGSNIIVSDKGLNIVFLRLSAPFFRSIVTRGNDIICSAGASINRLCSFAEEHDLTGAEFLVGIPATVGGAVYQNAGAYSHSISGILKSIECLDSSVNIVRIDSKDIEFRYRHSGLDNKIILSAVFGLKKSKKVYIQKNTDNYLSRRLLNQDYTAPSAGCVFKNPCLGNMSAGEMIDRCGLKGKRIGNASVSQKHANFIINRGLAKSEDIIRLMCFIKKKVKAHYRVNLESEIRFIK
jgi:UDP-N-acetylmuramate dehydrogenase